MSSFTTPLKLTFNDNDHECMFVVAERFSFWTSTWPEIPYSNMIKLVAGNRLECIINVEAGYATDFASIPKILWNIFPPHHPHYAKAAVVHDYLYSHGIGNKKWADAVFLEAMTVLGCPAWKRWIFHKAVTIGGRGAYGKHG